MRTALRLHSRDLFQRDQLISSAKSRIKCCARHNSSVPQTKRMPSFFTETLRENRKASEETSPSSASSAPASPPPKTGVDASLVAATDAEIVARIASGKVKLFDLENQLGDFERAVRIRRVVVEEKLQIDLHQLPYEKYDYSKVHGQCAENVIGYVPIPVGVAGPLVVDGVQYFVPLATTEGALIASTTRGCKAISASGGARTEVLADGITRAPVLEAPSLNIALQVKNYVEAHSEEIAAVFNSTSRFARLSDIRTYIAGRYIYLRFKCSTGDAMGMNMISKGTDKTVEFLTSKFPVQVLSLSGNVCTDKKPSAVNWIDGRGKSVVCEAVIKGDIVRDVLKTTVMGIAKLNYTKNLVGSAMAGSVGGFNAHASNIITALFLACGQDCAQNVESSTCLTLMEPTNNGEDLYVSVTMPSLEVGTIGGGTTLAGQSTCLNMLGVKGAHPTQPGQNAQRLARIASASVLAGELSLVAALSAGHLVSSHLKLNRKAPSPTSTH